MLENRSFDNLLGWLYDSDTPSLTIPPPAAGDAFHGLAKTDLRRFENRARGGSISSLPTRGARGFTVPTPDPGEEFEHVNEQFFGTPTPPPGAVATMTGVLEDFADVMQALGYSEAEIRRRAASIMESYTPSQLPVLSQLAKNYAVSDSWFASVPSQTNPNRAFTLCGTSHGLVNNGELESDPRAQAIEKILGMHIGDDRFPERTIFNAMQDAGRDWRVFWQCGYLPQKIARLLDAVGSIPSWVPGFGGLKQLLGDLRPYAGYLTELSSGDLASSYTWRLFPAIQQVSNAASHFSRIDEFHAMARSGRLPAFSYIEPIWTISQCGADTGLKRLFTAMGNDYHPPANLFPGESFLRDVYQSLIANREAWLKTVLIITFDEFVGTFDHISPPAAVPPWGAGNQPPFRSPTGFGFDRLGGRVPTIVVSPYVQKGTVFRSTTDADYDHTSIIATSLDMLGVPESPASFGQRAARAPKFDNVLTLGQPRTDEAKLAFLDIARSSGDPVRYGDQFILQHSDGDYLTRFKAAAKAASLPDSLLSIGVDLGVCAYFPTYGQQGPGAPLTFASPNPDASAVNDGDRVWVVSLEPELGADNVLGAWADSHDCYWYDLVLDGDNAAQEVWTIQKVARPGSPLQFGDRVRLLNLSYNQGLAKDDRWLVSGHWITTAKSGAAWTVQPFVSPPKR
jgi:phospholipase C